MNINVAIVAALVSFHEYTAELAVLFLATPIAQSRDSNRDVNQSPSLSPSQDGSVPERDVKFSVEVLSLDSWAKLIQYDAFRDLLGPGMNTHLQVFTTTWWRRELQS